MHLKINKLQHVGIPVTNLARSIEFYERLGFKSVMNANFEFNGDTGSVAMMQLNDVILELYQMPEAELREIRSRGNGHIDHIAFDVDDIDETFEVLQENGFKPIESSPVFLNFWSKGCKYFNILGPDGERLEFNMIV